MLGCGVCTSDVTGAASAKVLVLPGRQSGGGGWDEYYVNTAARPVRQPPYLRVHSPGGAELSSAV